MNAQQAYRKVRSAIKSGALVRPSSCERCGESNRPASDGRSVIHAHHHDYNRPLDVEWLCAKCHRAETPLPKINGQAKLTPDMVRYIRASNETSIVLGRKLGVHNSTVRRARRGELWVHVLAAHEKEHDDGR